MNAMDDGVGMRRHARGVLAVACAFLLSGSVWGVGGDVIWTDQFDKAGGDDRAFEIAVSGSRVFVAGREEIVAGDTDFLVRAHDAKTGVLLWEEQFGLASQLDEANDIAAGGGAVFVAGSGENLLGNRDWLVRAYDAETGAVLWTDQFNPNGGLDRATDIVVRGGRVFVCGISAAAPFTGLDFVVRAYDAETGALDWQDVFNPNAFDGALALDVRGGTVFVAGFGGDDEGDENFLVRAYDAETGALLWQDQHDVGGKDQAADIAAQGGRVFVAGFGDDINNGDRDWIVRAYDADTGVLLWEDQHDLSGGLDQAREVAVSGSRVFVAGLSQKTSGSKVFTVRAYDGESGALLWQDAQDVGGGQALAFGLAVSGKRVFAAGTAFISGINFVFFVRAYDGLTGALLWEDQHNLSGRDDRAFDVAIHGNRVFAAGEVENASGNRDYFLRVYRAQ